MLTPADASPSQPRHRARWINLFLGEPATLSAPASSLTAELAHRGFRPRRHACRDGGSLIIWHPPGPKPRPDWSAIHLDADEREPFAPEGTRNAGDLVDVAHDHRLVALINLSGMLAGVLIACAMALTGIWHA